MDGVLFGHRACVIDDLDGDGERDWAVSAPLAMRGRSAVGSVLFLSSRTHQVLARVDGESPRAWFGWKLDQVEDLDGDGHAEIACGELDWSWPPGGNATVRILSGKDASVLQSYAACVSFLSSRRSGRNVTRPELLFNACFVRQIGCFDGRTGSRTATIGVPEFDSLVALHDEDNRPTPELVGELTGRPGSLACFSIEEPTKCTALEVPYMDLHTVRLGITGLRLRVDREEAIVVGIPAWNEQSGGVFVLASRTGNLLRQFDMLAGEPNTRDISAELGYALLAVPDLDGDGQADIVVSGPEYGLANGVVIAWSAAQRKVIWQAGGEVFGNVGTSLDLLDDVDRDGVRDLLVGGGDHGLSNGRMTRNGTVRVLSGADGKLIDIVYESQYPELRGSADKDPSPR